jgi:hypothetical protein
MTSTGHRQYLDAAITVIRGIYHEAIRPVLSSASSAGAIDPQEEPIGAGERERP